jgi:hypothetical protein
MPTVTITGQSAVASAGNLRIFTSDWYSFYYDQQQVVDANSIALFLINGIESVGSLGNLNTPSPDWYAFYNEQYLGIQGFGSAINQLSSIQATAQLGTAIISGTENVSVVISGVDIVSSIENVITQSSENAQIAIFGIEAVASVGSVTATQESAETWSSGQIKRYPANAFKNSSVKLSGIVAQSSQNDISASGTVQIDATVALNNVVSFSQVANINADGILSISDDEIILLMAA